MPSALKSFNVEIGSAPLEKFLITDFPLARLDSITALCEIVPQPKHYLLKKIFVLKSKVSGEVSERLKVQTWKVCAGETSPGVRIPPSPFF